MLSTRHTQSLSEFRQKAGETLDRINQTHQAEILTVNGQARAVLLSPSAYDEINRDAQSTRDAAFIRRALQESADGKGRSADAFFDEVRAMLRSMKPVSSEKLHVRKTAKRRAVTARRGKGS